MKTLIAIAFASVAMISSAFAGEIQGVVQTVDTENNTLVLDSGETFTLAQGVELQDLQAGQTVKVVFDDNTKEALEIDIVK